MKSIIVQCWDSDPEKRPNFKQVTDFINSLIESRTKRHAKHHSKKESFDSTKKIEPDEILVEEPVSEKKEAKKQKRKTISSTEDICNSSNTPSNFSPNEPERSERKRSQSVSKDLSKSITSEESPKRRRRNDEREQNDNQDSFRRKKSSKSKQKKKECDDEEVKGTIENQQKEEYQ